MNFIGKILTRNNNRIISCILKSNKFIMRHNKPVFKILLTAAYISKEAQQVEKIDDNKLITPEDFTEEIKKACQVSEKKIHELIQSVGKSILKVSEEYRACLEKQITMLNRGMQIDPLSDYWDELVKYRVEASGLRKEFDKYQGLLEYIGQLAFNLTTCYMLLDETEAALSFLQREFDNLQKIAEEQVKLNKIVEKKLLELDTLLILKAPNK